MIVLNSLTCFIFYKLKRFNFILIFILSSNFIFSQSSHINVAGNDTTFIYKKGIKEITIKDINGTVKEVLRYKDTLKHGIQEVYFQNGIINSKTNYINGHQEGLMLVYNYQGLLIEEKKYLYNSLKNISELNGEYRTYLDNKVQIKATYKNGLRIGKYIEYYPAGHVKLIANYKEGKLDGLKEEYANNKQITSRSNYKLIGDKDNRISVLDGRSLIYGPGKILLSDLNYKLGNKDGSCKEYYSSGILKQEVTYKDGKRNGLSVSYYENGVMKLKNTFYEIIQIKDSLYKNIYDGLKLEFFASGKLQSRESYKLGKKEGEWERFSENGKLIMISEYSNDLKVGEHASWDAYGNMTAQTFYTLVKNDSGFVSLKNGPERSWTDGKLVSETYFVYGKEEGIRRNYYKSGQISFQTTMVNDFMNGETSEYYEDGSLKSIRNYYGIYDASKNKKYFSVGWRKEFEKDKKIKLKILTDSLENTIFMRRYFNANQTSIDLNKVFSINYFPDGKVMSIIVKDEFDREVFGQYYYRNGKIRKVVFQNVEKQNIANVDFADNGEVLNRSSQAYLNPDSLLPSLEIIKELKRCLGEKLLSNKFYTDTILDGSYELFYSTGKPMAYLTFKDDLPNGDFIFFYPLNGDTLSFKQFELGMSNGIYINKFAGKYYVLNGRKPSRSNDGFEERYRQNGVIENKRVYSKLNKQLIENTEYFENGKIRNYQNYLSGEYANYGLDGKLLSQTIIIDSISNIKETTEYYPDLNVLKSKKFSRQNKYDGEALTYFKNGQIESRTIYSAGVRNGLYERFDILGTKILYGQYVDDKQEGVWMSFKDGIQEELLYKNNKLQVATPQKVCSCIDTSYSANNLRFAPTISTLIEYPKLKNNFSGFFKVVDSLNYQSVFFTGLQTSNGTNSGFASLNLLMFKEFAVTIPADEQLKLVFNPCITKGYISRMQAYVNYSSIAAEDTKVTFFPARISISIQKGPVKSNSKDYSFPTAFFNMKDIEYDYKYGFKLNMADTTNSCFTPIIIRDFLKIDVKSGGPLEFDQERLSNDYFFINAGILKKEESKAFFGFSYSDAAVRFPMKTNLGIIEVNASSNSMLAGGKFACGIISIPCHKIGEDLYSFIIDDQEYQFSSQEIKVQWIKNGFSRVKLSYDQTFKKLNLNFFVE